MTTPVETDDIVSGAVKHLLSIPGIVSLVGSDERGPFIWQHSPLANMEQYAATAIVILPASPWSGGSDAHTYRAQRLGIEFWVGPFRDELGNVIEFAEGRRRLNEAFRAVDKVFHRVNPHTEYWGTVRTHSSERIGDLDSYSPLDGKELIIGQAFYGVLLD